MPKSMTGYGCAVHKAAEGRYIVEISSVNRKHLEIHTHLPRELSAFDTDVRKWIGESIRRGHVTVRVSVSFDQEPPFFLLPNIPYLRQMKEAWDLFCREAECEGEPFPLTQFLRDESALLKERNFEFDTEHRQSLATAVKAALEKIQTMRSIEGQALRDDLLQRIEVIIPLVDFIAQNAQLATKKYKDLLLERLKNLIDTPLEQDERVLKEIALYAEKIDICEEVTRLNSHLKQFVDQLKYPSDTIGKTLEFILQEMHREINTIGSKSGDYEISKKVVAVKTELERIREQIQNLE